MIERNLSSFEFPLPGSQTQPKQMALRSSTTQQVAARSSSARQVAPARALRARSVVVRASEAAAPAKEAKPAWSEPKLNVDTPSPIFGGSTGGLLRKAQVIAFDCLDCIKSGPGADHGLGETVGAAGWV